MEVEGSKVPVLVRDLCRFRITSISLGRNHTAVLTERGKVITFGRNVEGQLGSSNTRPQQALTQIRPLDSVQAVVCWLIFYFFIHFTYILEYHQRII